MGGAAEDGGAGSKNGRREGAEPGGRDPATEAAKRPRGDTERVAERGNDGSQGAGSAHEELPAKRARVEAAAAAA
eukprot:scaffold75186_cov14-Tisochrysis_lutea.AAC.1